MRPSINRRALIGIGATTVIVGIMVGGSGAANGAPSPLTDAELIAPASVGAAGTFYTDGQIDQVWAAVTKAYPEPLPNGANFQSMAPSFFHPKDNQTHLFQVGLVDLIAARYWRCAWIAESLSSLRDHASTAIATEMLGLYGELPSVSHYINVPEYQQQMVQIAATLKTDPLSAEYQVDCIGVTE